MAFPFYDLAPSDSTAQARSSIAPITGTGVVRGTRTRFSILRAACCAWAPDLPAGVLGFRGPDVAHIVVPGDVTVWIESHAYEELAKRSRVVWRTHKGRLNGRAR